MSLPINTEGIEVPRYTISYRIIHHLLEIGVFRRLQPKGNQRISKFQWPEILHHLDKTTRISSVSGDLLVQENSFFFFFCLDFDLLSFEIYWKYFVFVVYLALFRCTGVDFKIKLLTVGGKRLKLTIWDTSGQERFRTLTSSYYRGAHGIILVYDVKRRDTFTNLSDVWAKELELYSTNLDCIKMLIGNKVDREAERVVSREEGLTRAKELGCLFLECSAQTRTNVEQCFEELALKIMEVPRLLEEGSTVVKRGILKQKQEHQKPPTSGCCSS
ncbi:ras-related protein RABC2a-like [Primulina eburnea]|uniref:ras-related protein RABC2a-like n=1 Tax=Primulina eburnea TaxID=1245227 RepID=UPI003C6BF0F3